MTECPTQHRLRFTRRNQLIHDRRFAVYGPGLWLLSNAYDGNQPLAASVDQVRIEGQPSIPRLRYSGDR